MLNPIDFLHKFVTIPPIDRAGIYKKKAVYFIEDYHY